MLSFFLSFPYIENVGILQGFPYKSHEPTCVTMVIDPCFANDNITMLAY